MEWNGKWDQCHLSPVPRMKRTHRAPGQAVLTDPAWGAGGREDTSKPTGNMGRSLYGRELMAAKARRDSHRLQTIDKRSRKAPPPIGPSLFWEVCMAARATQRGVAVMVSPHCNPAAQGGMGAARR